MEKNNNTDDDIEIVEETTYRKLKVKKLNQENKQFNQENMQLDQENEQLNQENRQIVLQHTKMFIGDKWVPIPAEYLNTLTEDMPANILEMAAKILKIFEMAKK